MRTHLLVACVAAGILALPFPVRAAGPAAVSSKGSFLSVDIDNSPPGELLGAMAKEGLIEIRGAMPAGATLTLHSSDLTLEQVLGKIMRGYNYVLVEQGKAGPPLLTILGRIQRSPAEAPKAPAAAPSPPEDVSQLKSYVPPQPPSVPTGKDGKPLPHWVDDEGRVRIIGEPTPPEQTAAGVKPQQANGQAGQGQTTAGQAQAPVPQTGGAETQERQPDGKTPDKQEQQATAEASEASSSQSPGAHFLAFPVFLPKAGSLETSRPSPILNLLFYEV